jgi:hypothetical protein
MDSPDRNRFRKLALYHNHSWWPQAIAQGRVLLSAEHPPIEWTAKVLSFFKNLNLDHAWGLPAPPRLIISMAVFSTAAVRFLRRFAFGRSR